MPGRSRRSWRPLLRSCASGFRDWASKLGTDTTGLRTWARSRHRASLSADPDADWGYKTRRWPARIYHRSSPSDGSFWPQAASSALVVLGVSTDTPPATRLCVLASGQNRLVGCDAVSALPPTIFLVSQGDSAPWMSRRLNRSSGHRDAMWEIWTEGLGRPSAAERGSDCATDEAARHPAGGPLRLVR